MDNQLFCLEMELEITLKYSTCSEGKLNSPAFFSHVPLLGQIIVHKMSNTSVCACLCILILHLTENLGERLLPQALVTTQFEVVGSPDEILVYKQHPAYKTPTYTNFRSFCWVSTYLVELNDNCCSLITSAPTHIDSRRYTGRLWLL